MYIHGGVSGCRFLESSSMFHGIIVGHIGSFDRKVGVACHIEGTLLYGFSKTTNVITFIGHALLMVRRYLLWQRASAISLYNMRLHADWQFM